MKSEIAAGWKPVMEPSLASVRGLQKLCKIKR